MPFTGHIFQEEKGDGIPEGEDAREVEGRGCTEDAWGDWTRGKALKDQIEVRVYKNV